MLMGIKDSLLHPYVDGLKRLQLNNNGSILHLA